MIEVVRDDIIVSWLIWEHFSYTRCAIVVSTSYLKTHICGGKGTNLIHQWTASWYSLTMIRQTNNTSTNG